MTRNLKTTIKTTLKIIQCHYQTSKTKNKQNVFKKHILKNANIAVKIPETTQRKKLTPLSNIKLILLSDHSN